jgi:hypothetical protein
VTTTASDDLDRTTSGRFVRNLALSLGGGALITLLGASAAHADDATTASDGAGAAHSGDATAVGNQSGSDTTQSGTPSGGTGSLQVINQTGVVANTGAAVANTGGNGATGNASTNNAQAVQSGLSLLGPVASSGTAANSSDGRAFVSTGNASAYGNQSTTSLSQTAVGDGALGGIIVVNQTGAITNSGVALANTGINDSAGNERTSGAAVLQTAQAAAGLATNTGSASNTSNGKATISTGSAKAVGNHSDATLVQSSNGAAGGDTPGLVVIGQSALVANLGVGVANTGINEADGNEGLDDATVLQNNGVLTPEITGVASNSADASSWSDGTAGATTGAATATGSSSTTGLHQATSANLADGGGLALPTQAASVVNAGLGIADTGNNEADGNASVNTAGVDQNIEGDGVAPYVGVASNSGTAGNTSDGTGTVRTGDAWASGNESETVLDQVSVAEPGDLHVLPQLAGVQNLGGAFAETGGNLAGGNAAESTGLNPGPAVTQNLIGPADSPLGATVQSNQAEMANASDGSGHVTTGDARATGNRSATELSQDLDPTGLILPVQVADVVNLGAGVANTGGNAASGNESDNSGVDVSQGSQLGDTASPVTIAAGQIVTSNSAHAGNPSDGTASVATGDATATGNDSSTHLAQTSTGSIEGAGLITNTQAAVVANVGLGVASTGLNAALGNGSQNDATATQRNAIGSLNTDPTTVAAGIITASNSAAADTTSDGSASIRTGDASATGNRSATDLSQDEAGQISGMGTILNTQVAAVANVGVGIANSGLNAAVGNLSNNRTDTIQNASIGTENDLGPTQIFGGTITAANQADVDTTSDGTADIATGDAAATGSTSDTELHQQAGGAISGLGLEVHTQVGGVLNAGLGVASSGGNLAVGNASDNDQMAPTPANLVQIATIGSNNSAASGPTTIAGLSVTASNAATASTTSDGDASVRTGAATATGNASSTDLVQDPDSAIDGGGAVIGTQIGGVANIGAAIANSGLNVAVGNASGQLDLLPGPDSATALVVSGAGVGSGNEGIGPNTIVALGPLAATTSGSASNSSDGSATVGTGRATATGNTSSTVLEQRESGSVSDLGLVVGTQVGGVANVGVGIANSGLNAAVGNASSNVASTDLAQIAGVGIDTAVGDPMPAFTALGPVVASASIDASNSSDGDACVCTGDATASGNISETTLDQELGLATTGGVVVATEAGGVLNLGIALANSGANLAIGNVSNSTATLDQLSDITDALVGLPVVGPQVASASGTIANTSAGSGKVGTGNATAIGNQSTTAFAQSADVDSQLAFPTLVGGTGNVGLGLANAGANLGVGNASTNVATLSQTADGAGIVSNQGEARNDSDGTATIGDPDCDVPEEEDVAPPTPSLPRTGGPLEVEAAIGLLLLLAGFGIRRKAATLG